MKRPSTPALTVTASALAFASVLWLALGPAARPGAAQRPSASSEGTRVFELRTYHTNPGKLADLHRRSREHLVRYLKKHGADVIGFWTPQDAEKGKADTLVYMLAFPSREAAKASWKALAADPGWKKAFEESHRNGVVVHKVESVFLDPTDYSPLR
jgi:hypothetical protein